jgi:raffinose/stachyose/melibiose transport system substrate-binding protein
MQALDQTTGGKAVDTTFATLQGQSPTFTDKAYVDAFQGLATLGSSNIFANGYQALQEDAANALFSSGKAAMFFGGTWDVSTIMSQAPSLNIKVIPFPTFVDGASPNAFGGTGMAVAAYAKAPSGDQDLDAKLVDYMAGADVAKVLDSAASGALNLPTVKGLQPATTSALGSSIIDTLLPKTQSFLDWYWPKEVTAAFQNDIQSVVGGKMTPDAAAQDVQNAFDGAVANGWKFAS